MSDFFISLGLINPLLFLKADTSLFASSNQSCKYLISFFDFQGIASIFSCHFIYHSAWARFLYIKSLVSNGTFSLFISGVLTVASFFATIDFFSGTTGVVFKADSVVAFGFALLTIGGFVAFGFALLTIGGFVATALITLSGLGASVFRINHNDHFMIPFSINQPSSFIIC
jgi:hypothetical protein